MGIAGAQIVIGIDITVVQTPFPILFFLLYSVVPVCMVFTRIHP
jgi:hypothetical protein